MHFHFDLDEYRGASADWTILVTKETAGDLPDRIFGLRLQPEAGGFPIGHLRASKLGADDCEYSVEVVANLLDRREAAELDGAARAHVSAESESFGRALRRA